MSITTHKTFCRFCHAYCAIEVDVENDQPIAVRGDTSDPMYGGYTCIKGRQLPEQFATPKRIRETLKQTPNGEFRPIATEQAMDEISEKINQLIKDYGPRSVATYVGSYGYQNSAALHVAKAWHQSVGSPSYYTSVTIDQPHRKIAQSQFGTWGGGTHAFTGADVCMMIGNNPVVSQYTPFGGPPPFSPYARIRDEMKRGMKLIVVDPRRTEVANRASLHLQVNPAEDPTFLSAVIRWILVENLHDKAFCEAHVDDLAGLQKLVEPFTPSYAAARCGIEEADLIEAARLFGTAKTGVTVSGTGPNMSPRAILTEHLICCLNTLCGRVNKVGARVPNPGVLQPNRPRTADVIPANPAYGKGPRSRIRGLGEIIGEMPTATLNDEILTPGEGQIKALICLGGNPVVAFPDQDKTVRAMKHLELLVCVDLYQSATAKLADYVVAPTLSLERDDVTMLTDTWYDQPYSHYTKAILPRNPESREEWEIYWELSHRSGMPLSLPGGELDPSRRPSKFEVLQLLTPNAQIPLTEIAAVGHGKIFESVEVRVAPGDSEISGRFQLLPADIPQQLAEVASEDYWQSKDILDNGKTYSHLLISRRLKHVFNSSGQQLESLRKKGTTNPAYMHSEDLAALGLSSGDLIEIASAAGTLSGVVEAADDIKPGVISMAHAWGDLPDNGGEVRSKGASTNRLVDDDRTYNKITGMPRMSAIPVNVRAIQEAVA